MKTKKIRLALAGNPNVGKTTIFNAITGSRQHVGNWPGVTVEKKIGTKKYGGYEFEVVDLPGTYSLTAYSTDEVVARDYIIDEKPDVVVHIVDSTNLERNLYLTTQLLELGTRVVIALNMVDISEGRGDYFDIHRIEEFLETPVVKTIGSKGKGITDLLDEVIKEAQKGPHHEHEIGYGKQIEKDVSKLEDILRKDAEIKNHFPLRWLSVKILEGDTNAFEKIKASAVKNEVIQILDTVDKEEYEATMADKRYEVINSILPQVCTTCIPKFTVSDMIDRVFTNKYFGIPIFLAMFWAAFELTFTFASPFMDIIDMTFAWIAGAIWDTIQPYWLASLLGDGIIGGVGFVMVFIPNIFILFLLLSFLEDSGYLARAAFIMDRLMYKIGLTGKSFIPMLMGFGCNVPAIMATRTIEDKKDRLITIIVNPFISCGARLPVFVLIAGAFFGRNAGTVIFSMYVLGLLVAICSAKLLRNSLFKGKPSPFVMELPPYRIPTIRTGMIHMWERGSLYLKKAGTVILFGALCIWVLASFPFGVEYGSEASFAGHLGNILEPLVAPLGFDWKIAVALVFGFVAKEIVVGTLGVLYGADENEEALTSSLQGDSDFTALTGLSLMVFTLIYMPCLATVGVIKKETGSWKWTLFTIIYGIVIAYILTFIIFQIGRMIEFGI